MIFLHIDYPIVGGHGSRVDTVVETVSLIALWKKFSRHGINLTYLTFTVIDESKM